jgi:uncharacterized protein YkwD
MRLSQHWRLSLVIAAAMVALVLASWGVAALVRHTGDAPPGAVADPSATQVQATGVMPGDSAQPGSSTVATTPVPPPPSDDTIATMEARVVTLVNSQRAGVGCTAMTVDSRLATAALDHAKDMATRGYFSHTTPEGKSFDARIRDAGYNLSSAAENIAFGQPSAESVMDAWMASADHKANILNCNLRNIGVGLAYDGASQPYWAQTLASPA